MKKKVYVCDCCKFETSEPHDAMMKEFFVSFSYERGSVFPMNFTRKTRVHLCPKCIEKMRSLVAKEEV